MSSLLKEKRFSFPKSLYSTHDTIRFFVANKPNALILDFFAGSGTTMHAVNLLNAEDGGHRRCIMVTNNEVSADEAKMLKDKGYQPAMRNGKAWHRPLCYLATHGLFHRGARCEWTNLSRAIILQRASDAYGGRFQGKCGILQTWVLGSNSGFSRYALFGNAAYVVVENWCKRKMPGIDRRANAGHADLAGESICSLINENTFADFAEKLAEHPEIQTVFLATDYEVNYQSMVKNLNVANAYQLYRDYLDHFRVNRGRN